MRETGTLRTMILQFSSQSDPFRESSDVIQLRAEPERINRDDVKHTSCAVNDPTINHISRDQIHTFPLNQMQT